MEKYYQCIKCKKTYPFTKGILTCSNHSPYYGYLILQHDYKNAQLHLNSKNLWEKYADLLPVTNHPIQFDEQKTPLVKLNNFGKKHGFSSLYVKDESKNPTGSFKDIESQYAINKAIEWGIDEIFVVSSGNAAVSTAAYAQKAGIKCTCYVPKKISAGKEKLIKIYGGIIKKIDGSYETVYRDSLDKPYVGWNCTPGINPIKEEGTKIIGFELYEETGVPDVIIVPCGNGTLLFGIYKAFKELKNLEVTKKLPKLIGVQIKNASPLYAAFKQKKDFVTLSHVPESLAEGIIAGESYSSPKVMLALKETKGEIIEVGEEELLLSLKEIITLESLIPEPTSAVVFVACKKLKKFADKKIVLIQTAGGMKNLKEITQTFTKKQKN